MKKIQVILFALILTACGAAAPQVTVTLTPAATLTASPTFTETPISTAIPTLTPDQQTAMDSAKVAYADTGWEIQPSGEVTGAPEGVTYNVEKGVLTRTYMYEGIELTVDLTINTETPKPDGCVVNFEGWCLTKEKELARKTFRTERLQDGTFGIGGYGYVGDGNPEHANGVPILNVAEQQATLASPVKTDMTGISSFNDLISFNIKHSRKYHGQGIWFNGSTPEQSAIAEPGNMYGWGDNRIFRSDGKGEYTEIATAPFLFGELENNPISKIIYIGYDGEIKIMFGDTGELMNSEAEINAGNDTDLSKWYAGYGPENRPALW